MYIFLVKIYTSQFLKGGNLKKSQVIITHYYNPPTDLNAGILIDESEQTGEYLEVEVHGEILNFKYIHMTYDHTKEIFVDKKRLYEKNQMTNQRVYITCYLPEGIPSEKLTWQDQNGKKYEHILQEDGMGRKQWQYLIDH